MSLPDAPASDLPLVLYKADLAQVLRRSVRSVERLDRAHKLPERLLPGRPSWSRDTVLSWLAGGGLRRGRRP